MPLIVWALIALAGFGAVTFAAWAIQDWLKTPQRIAFIGRPATGKSTMLYLLSHGELPADGLAPTFEPDEAEINIQDGINIRVTDTGGDRLDQWDQAVARARGVVYFFDAAQVAAGDPDTLSALDADADNIDELFQDRHASRRFTLVGTHSDLFEGSDDAAKVKRHPVVQRIRQAAGADADDLILGSLGDKKSAVKLAAEVAKRQSRKP